MFQGKIPTRTRMAVILILILSLGGSVYLYGSAYSVPREEAKLGEAITALHASSDIIEADAEIIELVDVEDVLVAFYRERQNPQVYGFAIFEKGWNQKLRLVSTSYRETGFSSILQAYVLDYRKLRYYIVGGYGVEGAISAYSLDFFEDSPKSQMGEVNVKFDVPGGQFLNVHKASEVDREVMERQGEGNYKVDAQEVSLFDSAGNNVTETYLITGMPRGSFAGGGNVGGIGKTYFLILFILGAAGVYIRYALLEPFMGRHGGFPEGKDSKRTKNHQVATKLLV